MISAKTAAFAAMSRRLEGRARAIAEAHSEDLLRAQTRDPWRWRDARLLWPSFTRET